MASRAARAIADSRERPICGGSDAGVVGSIRDRIRQGLLPLVDGNVSAQLGTGRVCVICGDSIRVPEVEYLADQTGGLRAHPPCYTLWLVESERAKRRPPGPRATTPASRADAVARQPEPPGE